MQTLLTEARGENGASAHRSSGAQNFCASASSATSRKTVRWLGCAIASAIGVSAARAQDQTISGSLNLNNSGSGANILFNRTVDQNTSQSIFWSNASGNRLGALGVAAGNQRPSFTGWVPNDDDLYFYTTGANAIGFATNATGRLVIDSSGQVGIGTSNPGAKLDIIGNSGPYGDFIGYSGTTGPGLIWPNGTAPEILIERPNIGACMNPPNDTYRGGIGFGYGVGIYSVNPNPAGSPYYGDIRFHTTWWDGSNYRNSDRMAITMNGNVGIGTNTPGHTLDVNGDISAAQAIAGEGGTQVVSTPWWCGYGPVTGYVKLVTPIQDHEGNMFTIRITGYRYSSGSDTFTIQASGYAYTGTGLINTRCRTAGTDLPVEIGTETRNGMNVVVLRIGTPSSSWYYPNLSFEYRGWNPKRAADFAWTIGETTPAQTGNTNNVVIRNDSGPSTFNAGNVGIGTTAPDKLLTVRGTIHATEVLVDTTVAARDLRVRPAAWADDVLAPGHRLQPLGQVAKAIREQGHLPGVPSAKEVAANGVSVGDMQSILLRKIEELTLHVIEIEKENTQLRQRVEQLEERK